MVLILAFGLRPLAFAFQNPKSEDPRPKIAHFPKPLKYDNLHVKGTCCSFASDCDSLQDRVFINSIQVEKRVFVDEYCN